MVQLTIIHPTSLTSPISGKICLMISTEVGYIEVWISPWHTHRFGVSSFMDSRLTSTPRFPHQLGPLIFKTFSFWIRPSRFGSLSIMHHYHLRHNSPHTNATFLFHIWWHAMTTFETNPYTQQYHLQVHSATLLRSGNSSISVRFLNTFFLMFFKIVSHIANTQIRYS